MSAGTSRASNTSSDWSSSCSTGGGTIPSPALLNRNHERLVAELEALEARTGVPVVRFKTGESKEDLARPFQDAARATGRPGLVLVGKAQERTSVWRGYVDDTHAGHRPSHPHMAWRRQSSVNNASDFALHKTLSAENWNALRRAGADTNARFLATLGEGRPGLPDPATSSRSSSRASTMASGPPVCASGIHEPWLSSAPSPPSPTSSAE